MNGDSAGNYHLMDEESTGGMVILPGITSLWTRNPPVKVLFRRELQAQPGGIHAPEEWDSAENYQLIYADSERQD
jgi:hypothetical protein